MSLRDELELLDQVQQRLEPYADAAELHSDVDRRHFMFTALVAAATTIFGHGAEALAQESLTGIVGVPQSELPPIEDWEPLAWVFQPYPAGTGAAMEKLIAERGAAAFKRSAFVVRPWSGAVPSAPDDLAFLPAHRLAALMKARRITSTQLARIYLERLKRLNPTLNCAITILEERGLAEAAQADAEIRAGKYRGPLHGLPYGLKDIYAARGGPTTWGQAIYEHRVIDEDAEVAARLREAGAVLIAKTSVGQEWFRGRTNNPWDIRRGTSGSSSGSASATAAGCVAFSIGEETSGSLVSPARECGITTLRPTFGRVSRYGMRGVTSQSRVGPLCRTIEDCAMAFSVIHGVDPKDTTTVTTPFQFDRNIDLRSVRIGFDPKAPQAFVDGLREIGARPVQIGPRPVLGSQAATGAETAATRDAYVQAKAKELGIDLATVVAAPRDTSAGRGGRGGESTPASALASLAGDRTMRAYEFLQRQRRRHVLIRETAEVLKDVDMYVPAWENRAFGDLQLHAQTGHPCVVVPYAFGSPPPPTREETGGPVPPDAATTVYHQQPLGAVLAGNLYRDDTILSVAHRFQETRSWASRRPDI